MPAKTRWKPGNLVVPAPAALISCKGKDGKANLITLAWCGNVNSDPPMLFISVRPSRFSHALIAETGECVVNIPSKKFARAVDYCGVTSGRNIDKWETCSLTPLPMERVACPGVAEMPINIGCRITRTIALPSHDMFLAEIVEVAVDENLVDAKGKFRLEKADILAYAHGEYRTLGDRQGSFGWSIRKKPKRAAPARARAKPAAKPSAKAAAKPRAKSRAKSAKG